MLLAAALIGTIAGSKFGDWDGRPIAWGLIAGILAMAVVLRWLRE